MGENSHQDRRNYPEYWSLMCDVGTLKLFQGIEVRPEGAKFIVEYQIKNILLIKKTFYAC